MATRQSHGPKLTRPDDKRKDTGGRSTAVPSTPSMASNVTTGSRIPTNTTYLFPKPTVKRTDTSTSGSSRETIKPTVSRLPRSMNASSSPSLTSASKKVVVGTNGGIGLGIHKEPIQQDTSSVSYGSRQSNLLRRKASSNDNRIQYARSESIASHERQPQQAKLETVSSPGGYTDPFPGSILGISLPAISTSTSHLSSAKPRISEQATSSSRMAHFMSRRLPYKISTHELVPPNPSFAARSSSASTRCSESPGPFSRTSTPTSNSSHSPGLSHAPKFVSRLKPPVSPISKRPPVTKRRVGGVLDQNLEGETQGLPILRESVTSSSSSSTVRAVEHVEDSETTTTKNHRPTVPPPSLPLRSSSKRLPKPRMLPNSSQRGATLEESSSLPPADSSETNTLSQKPSLETPLSDEIQRKAPVRPSRDGAPSLDDNTNTSPIIRSNLNQILTSGHKRRESAEKAALAQTMGIPVPTGIKPALTRTLSSGSKPSKNLSKLPSPNLGKPKDTVPSIPKVATAQAIPRLQTSLPVKSQNPEPSPQSGTSVKSTKKFSLFSRPIKSSPEINSLPTITDRNKGPAAGTGHEGYGKYGRRGRSGSISSNSSRGRSTSSTRPSSSRKSSFASQDDPELDEFYKDRLAPVIIGGGGHILDNRNSGAGFYRTSGVDNSTDSIDSRPSHTAISTNNTKSATLSTKSDSNIRNSSRNHRRLPIGQRNGALQPPKLDDDNLGKVSSLPSLATRRSIYRSQLLKEANPRRVPPPINTDTWTSSPSLDSHETFQSSIPATNSTTSLTDDISEGREGNWLKPKPKKHLDRIKLPSKWNFFQRAQHSPKKITVEESRDLTQLPASVSGVSSFRSVAHYAILDGSEEDAPGTLDDKLRQIEEGLSLGKQDGSRFANISEQDEREETQSDQEFLGSNIQEQERKASMTLPSPPSLAGDFPRQQWLPPHNMTSDRQGAEPQLYQPIATPEVKEWRLPQVGRIPKPISKRDRLHKPPPQSFSRPFFKTKASVTKTIEPTGPTENATSTERFIPPIQAEDPSSREFKRFNFGQATTTPLPNESPLKDTSNTEFLVIPPRKDSEVSASSSSGTLDFTAVTAILPVPASTPNEDEVWNEYDEFLDHVVSPAMPPQFSAKKQAPVNRAFNVYHTQHQTSSGASKKESLVLGSNRSSESTISAPSPRLPLLPTLHHPPVSELPSLPNPETTPSTPLSFSDFFAGYGDRSSSIRSVIRQTSSSGSRYSSNSTISKSGSRSSRGSNHDQRYKQLMDQKTAAVHAQKNLRFSAVMTSRWLSFDRVLFSPAHEEIENNQQDRILVLDGLCNDDWSSYCALTYPDAIIYNIGSLGPLSAQSGESKNLELLPNHRQIHHAGFAHPFPFPKGFFAVVVFRFPVATSESVYYNAISESKRVLRPGGYLEMSILDIDMVNMGNRARRSIRALKTNMQIAEPHISLSPTSDIVQKMLGRRGFENLNRCMVGVPVAGCISDSRAGSLDEKDMSLNDMLKDASKQVNVPITKMVAKVGRWWWSRCYEVRGANTVEAEEEKPEQAENNSIWNDKALLKECEKRETGFKLLICYAQKPSNPRRRTVSV